MFFGRLRDMKKCFLFIRVFLYVVIIFIVLISVPFIIENILFNESTFPFSIPIRFGREVWFSFIASYIGALGTIALGLLAYWQNKRYKELSDTKDSEVKELQTQIKDLVFSNNELTKGNKDIQENIKCIIEKNTSYVESTNVLQQEIKKLIISDSELQKTIVELLEVNKNLSGALLNIQSSVYYPILSNMHHYIGGDSGKYLNYINADAVLSGSIISKIPIACTDVIEYIRDNCGFLSFGLINDGEKDIISLAFEDIIIENDECMYQNIRNTVDVMPHQEVRCILAYDKKSFDSFITHLLDKEITLHYSMKNTIGQTFIFSAELFVSMFDDDQPSCNLFDEKIELIDSLHEWRKKQIFK